jgi:hypothetical protein
VAILQEYQKVRETDQEVEYAYGYPEKDRRLTIHKAGGTPMVADGREDIATQAVFRGIMRRFRAENTWPNGGGVQH